MEMDKFRDEVGPALQKNETLMLFIRDMPRAYCVLEFTDTFDVATSERKFEYKNYRVLVSKQENIDKCKKELDDFVKGDFQVILRQAVI